MLRKWKGFVDTFVAEKEKQGIYQYVSRNFLPEEEGVCSFCGYHTEVSGRYLARILSDPQRGNHPKLFGYDVRKVCRDCAVVIRGVSTPSLGKAPRMFAVDETSFVPIESHADLKKVPPMSVVVFLAVKGKKIPSILLAIPTPEPSLSLAVNVIRGGDLFFFHYPLEELSGGRAWEGKGRKPYRLRVLDYINKHLGGEEK